MLSARKINQSLRISGTKQCNICQTIKPLEEFLLFSSGYYNSRCIGCASTLGFEYRNSFEGFFNTLFRCAHCSSKNRAEKGRVEAGQFQITKEDLISIWNKQNGKCYYSGIQMNLQTSSDWKCSLERLDDNKGYIIENIVLVCYEFNTRVGWGLEKVQEMLLLICENYDDTILLQEIESNINRVKSKRKWQSNVTNELGHYKCKNCGIFKSKDKFYRDINLDCKDCNAKYKKEYRSTAPGHLRKLFSHAKESTERRNNKPNRIGDNKFDITYEDIVTKLRDQRGKCAYSGIKLNYGSHLEKNWIASLERIDSTRGYEKDNICLVCLEFNGSDNTVRQKYSNGGSGAWSKEKFNFFLSSISNNVNSNSVANISETFVDAVIVPRINLCLNIINQDSNPQT